MWSGPTIKSYVNIKLLLLPPTPLNTKHPDIHITVTPQTLNLPKTCEQIANAQKFSLVILTRIKIVDCSTSITAPGHMPTTAARTAMTQKEKQP